ncbi:Hydrogenase maturating protein HypD [Yersinia aldovae ATCC 35236]|nr:Hydrogenase maturating protein HypD [Yersinia aldovae ATCC 35236]
MNKFQTVWQQLIQTKFEDRVRVTATHFHNLQRQALLIGKLWQ